MTIKLPNMWYCDNPRNKLYYSCNIFNANP